MELESTNLNARIVEIRQRYARLAMTCKAAGIRVNQETIKEYSEELERLQSELK